MLQRSSISPRPVSPGIELLEELAHAAHHARYNMHALARGMGCHPKQIWRRFRAQGVERPKAQLDGIRARRAAAAIASGASAKEAMVAFHYANPAHLTVALRKHVGKTPAQIINGGRALKAASKKEKERINGGARIYMTHDECTISDALPLNNRNVRII